MIHAARVSKSKRQHQTLSILKTEGESTTARLAGPSDRQLRGSHGHRGVEGERVQDRLPVLRDDRGPARVRLQARRVIRDGLLQRV